MSRDMRTVLNDGEQVHCRTPHTRVEVTAQFKKSGTGYIQLETPDGPKVFKSPSAFAMFVTGGKSANGWTSVFVKRGGCDIWLNRLPVAPVAPVAPAPAVPVAPAPAAPAAPNAEATDARVAALEAEIAALKETVAVLRWRLWA